MPEDIRLASDLPNGYANLGPLTDNGGPTWSQALLAGSQALDGEMIQFARQRWLQGSINGASRSPKAPTVRF
ncbi:MAG: hypothetical protein KF832_22330 [Caldilineaceae bacterium]|nr:hypothetical protein [Caldilineaceae bacterium]